jgi:hypothetical protein
MIPAVPAIRVKAVRLPINRYGIITRVTLTFTVKSLPTVETYLS